MVTTARGRVFSYVRGHPGTSVAQIGRALGMSAANVRHHLRTMVLDGRLLRRDKRRSGGRKGRPEARYSVSEALRGNNLAKLSDLLLSSLAEAALDLGVKLAAVAAAMAGQAKAGATDGQRSRRFSLVVARLNELHYESHWEAGATGPRIVLGHCPYAEIIAAHPELCHMDAMILNRLTGGSMEQTAKISVGGSESCVFAWRRGAPEQPGVS